MYPSCRRALPLIHSTGIVPVLVAVILNLQSFALSSRVTQPTLRRNNAIIGPYAGPTSSFHCIKALTAGQILAYRPSLNQS
jgi:hypothetical protein